MTSAPPLAHGLARPQLASASLRSGNGSAYAQAPESREQVNECRIGCVGAGTYRDYCRLTYTYRSKTMKWYTYDMSHICIQMCVQYVYTVYACIYIYIYICIYTYIYIYMHMLHLSTYPLTCCSDHQDLRTTPPASSFQKSPGKQIRRK